MDRRSLLKMSAFGLLLDAAGPRLASLAVSKRSLGYLAIESPSQSAFEATQKYGSAMLKHWHTKAEAIELQWAYTPIVAGRRGATQFFRPNAHWFAPASLVKLPLAIFVLEELERLQLDYQSLNIRFPNMPACAERATELRQWQPIERVLERSLVLSDDSSYCALYDFLGPAAIAARCAEFERDLPVPERDATRIQARFGVCGPEQSLVASAIELQDRASKKVLWRRPALAAEPMKTHSRPILYGKAWRGNNRLNPGPKDFANSNSLALVRAHHYMLALTRPELASKSQHLRLGAQSRSQLQRWLAMAPAQGRFSSANEQKQARTAFRLLGVGDGQWPETIQVHSKVGWSYGFLSDVAYLREGKNACILTASCYLNADGVLNDGVYEYERIGRPLFAELGRLLLRHGAQ